MISLQLDKDSSREQFWNKVHWFVVTKESKDCWKPFLDFTEVQIMSVDFQGLFQRISMDIVHHLIRMENEQKYIETETENVENYKLSDEEQEVLTYVAGFVVFSLTKKYKRILLSNNSKVEALAVLQLDSIKIVYVEYVFT